MDAKQANMDIQLIKGILEQTKCDISKTANFFIGIGIINLLSLLIKESGILLIGSSGITTSAVFALRSIDIVSFILIVFLYFFYYRSLVHLGNDLSKSILKIWGILIIGGELCINIFFAVFYELNGDISIEAFALLEKSSYFFLITIGFLFMGVLIHDNKIIISILLCIALYYFLFFTNISISIGNILGNSVIVYVRDILMSFLLSIGMILSGLYLRFRRS